MLCRQIEAATPRNHKKEARKTDSRCSAIVMTAATEYEFEILHHPPYFYDMVCSDFSLFPKRKSDLRGTQYGSNESVIETVNEYLGDQENPFYFKIIRKLEQRWA